MFKNFLRNRDFKKKRKQVVTIKACEKTFGKTNQE